MFSHFCIPIELRHHLIILEGHHLVSLLYQPCTPIYSTNNFLAFDSSEYYEAALTSIVMLTSGKQFTVN